MVNEQKIMEIMKDVWLKMLMKYSKICTGYFIKALFPVWSDFVFTAVKRVKFAKVKRNTSKLRLLLSLSKV